MRVHPFFAAVVLMSAVAACAGQSSSLFLDSSAQNHCTADKQGGMWLLRETTTQNPQRPITSVMTVTLRRIPFFSTLPSREIVKFVRVGETVELGCSEGPDGASYQLVSEK